MMTRMQTNRWFYWSLIVPGLTAAASAVGTVAREEIISSD